MPRNQIQAANKNLTKVSSKQKKQVQVEVLDQINDISYLMRDRNNIIIDSNYRLDAKPITIDGDGYKAGDYKLDIQTVTKQKKLSKTVAVVFLAPTATSKQDLIDSFNDSLNNQNIDRVT